MNASKPANKKDGKLTLHDFTAYPIWGFANDDGHEVMPVDYPGHLIWSGGGEALFVVCKFTFSDGSTQPGVINVRMTDRNVYVLKFPQANGKLFYFPVNSMLEGDIAPEELANHLRKSVDQVFPITYTTPYVFEDGQKLIGQYNLPTSKK